MRPRTARTLTAFADGTLPPEKREALRRRIARSARLSRAFERQLFAVEVVRSLSDAAPDCLHAWAERSSHDAEAVSEERGAVE